MSCIKSLPLICRLGIARVGIRTLLLVLFTCVMQHTAVLLGNSSTLNKRGENPPRFRRTTPAALSLANPLPSAQTLFSFSAVMAFHEALKTAYPATDNVSQRAPDEGEQRCGGCAKTHLCGELRIKDGLLRWPSDPHPAQSSFGKLSRNDTVDLYSLSSHRLKQWGQLGDILGGVRFPEGGASHWSV